MIYSSLKSVTGDNLSKQSSVWNQAFNFIKNLPAKPETGIYQIIGEDMFCNIMKYKTVQVNEARFESHEKYIDLQYTIEGEESIDWKLYSDLKKDGEFSVDADLQFYEAADSYSRIKMAPGYFCIFFKDDAHRPKIKSGSSDEVFKLVIKINKKLVSL